MKEFKPVYYYKGWAKYNEELSGDKVKCCSTPDSFILVLSDGLGSGVKANILATLTTEIFLTMFEEGIPLPDILETVLKTLPICEERKIAYSTFTVIQVFKNGEVRVVNFDNPDPIFVSNGSILRIPSEEQTIHGKKLKLWKFRVIGRTYIYTFSDGVLYAGLEKLLDLGWGYENISDYLIKATRKYDDLKYVVDNIMDIVFNYYDGQPGDDATLAGIYIREKKKLVIFTGPPLNKENDEQVVKLFLSEEGEKIICGGTTSNIVSRYVNKEVKMDLSTMRSDVPPFGELEGVGLVTEGVLTLSKTLELLEKCNGDKTKIPKDDKNAAVMLAKKLLEADECKFIFGQSINSVYQNPDLPIDISIRKNIIEKLANILSKYEKTIEVIKV
ncbi:MULTISPECIES: SpoIIE family protein phosphatase [unclassified Thermosipho (in: thermotogales)]|uniref:SpoIIE family protein phosphatase n=1 Tax=unclassified Thermosipho (in: thermotogales) TaxID=2676525 RepID=UPI0009869741|nr:MULTISPECIES: SpoIIE family protein phosphatase [unclassified Thermosipho (in: thermotogales)]MBT1247156.1 hypothetical protein [Thermosipho sp. 1244]OOC47091.1 hypothetical protein XO09_03210 [Thermosipho sp. 1223]